MGLVKTITATTPKTILVAPELAFALPVIVANTGVDADANGKKIIKAGTPIGGDTNVLQNRQTALVVTNTAEAGANSQGILLHDVDVTDGNANGTILIAGYVNINRIAESAVPVAEAQAALSRIVFMKGE
jgi:hypothetical protein